MGCIWCIGRKTEEKGQSWNGVVLRWIVLYPSLSRMCATSIYVHTCTSYNIISLLLLTNKYFIYVECIDVVFGWYDACTPVSLCAVSLALVCALERWQVVLLVPGSLL